MAYQNYAGAWLSESVQGPNISGSSPNVVVYGPDQNNTWGVTGASDTLMGGAHDDFYWLPNPGVVPVERAGGGVDTVQIWQNYVLPQNVENLIVFGNGQYAAGNAGDNIIKASASANLIYGGRGDDVFIGSGGGGTVFIVAQGEGDKVIQNFTSGADTLRLIGGGLTSLEAVKRAMTQQGSDVVLNDGGTHVLFRNATIGQFQGRDFQLPLNYASLGSQTFSEEFNSASIVGSKWQAAFGSYNQLDSYTLPRNGEQQIYTSANFSGTGSSPLGLNPFSFDNGVMTISARPVSSAQSAQMWGYKYSSGMLETSFAQTYGYFEMRAELPKGQGLWPAFWLVGDSNKEIDVLEGLGSDTRSAYNSVHSPAIGQGYSNASFNPYPDGYHTYGVLWDAQHITYYVDGTAVWRTATPSDMHSPLHMIVNLAVGGNWPGSPDGSTAWPAQMKVDYVHAYKLPGDGTNTGAPPPPPPSTGGTTPPPSSGAGRVLTATTANAVLAGGAGADTLNASQGPNTLTGGGGADRFVFAKEPWAPAHITDFRLGTDRLDLSALLKAAGYTGSNPVADHYLYFQSDGNGGTLIRFDHDGAGSHPQWPNSIIDLEHVSPGGLTWAQLAGGTAAGGSTGGGGTGSGAGGKVLTSAAPGSHLTGGAGADTLNASQGLDTLAGGAGGDRFVFGKEPWAPVHITDFQLGSDRLDLSALLKASGYAGSNPVGDHFVYLVSDGNGGTLVRYDRDGSGGDPQWPNSIIDLEHVSPSGLSWAQLSAGAGSTPAAGRTLTSTNPGSVLTGGSGADTLNASQGEDTLTGGAGADRIVFGKEPWAPIHVTDFQPGQDKLDLSALFKAARYTGSNPVADHYVVVESDGAGGALIRFDHDGAGRNPVWPNTIIDLEHVAPSRVSAADWIIH